MPAPAASEHRPNGRGDHRRQGLRGRPARRGRGAGRRAQGGARRHARPRRRAGRRRPGEPASTSATRARQTVEVGHALRGAPARRRHHRGRAARRSSTGSTPTRASTASSCSCRCRRTSTPTACSTRSRPTRTSTASTSSTPAASPAARRRLVPCTPLGCLMLLRDRLGDLAGLEAVVIGRSNIVGKPMAQLLLARQLHGHDRALAHPRPAGRLPPRRHPRRRGRPAGDGAGRLDQARRHRDRRRHQPRRRAGRQDPLVGDVDFAAAAEVAGAITPVPGGVGPMTIACLLANTLTATCRTEGMPDPEGLTPAR